MWHCNTDLDHTSNYTVHHGYSFAAFEEWAVNWIMLILTLPFRYRSKITVIQWVMIEYSGSYQTHKNYLVSRIILISDIVHICKIWYNATRHSSLSSQICGTIFMMKSSNGNIFRVTGLLWGLFNGHRWIPLTEASDAELWCFLCFAPEHTTAQTTEASVIWDATALIPTSL